MKTFNELTIGSSLYILDSKTTLWSERDQYGNIYNDGKVNRVEVIHSIKTGKGDVLLINEYSGYHSDGHNWTIPKETRGNFVFEDKSGKLVFSDESKAVDYIKSHVLSAIYHEEKEAKKRLEMSQKRIAEIRQKYWEVLNPSIKEPKRPN